MDESTARFLLFLVIGVVTMGWGLWRLLKDRRGPFIGSALLTGFILLWFCFAFMFASVSYAGAMIMVWGALFMCALLVVGTVLSLILNGYYVMKREGVSVAHALPLVVGLATAAAIAAFIYLNSGAFIDIMRNATSVEELRPFTILYWYIAVVVYVGFNLASYTLQAIIYGRWPRSPHLDAVVVLGARVHGKRVTPLLASRVDRGIAVARKSGAKYLVMSGGQGADEEVSEAWAMGQYAEEQAPGEFEILLEDRSRSTDENLRFSKELIARSELETAGEAAAKADPEIAVTTSNFHALRTAALARKMKLPWQVYGAPTALYYLPTAFLREFAANMVYHWKLHAFVIALITLFFWMTMF